MRIAITGGTGFIGHHLAHRLLTGGHEVVLLARSSRNNDLSGTPSRFVASDLSDTAVLAEAFAGCDAVAHCAGINRELGAQTFERSHIEGTRNVVAAAQQAGVKKIVLMSFLRARPNCGSRYHESKWGAEEIVRNSGIDHTIVKAGMVYGLGDQMLHHLSYSLHTFPLFATVGLQEKGIRPLAVEDLVKILDAALVKGRLPRQTVAVAGAEELYLSEIVRRVSAVIGKHIWLLPAPLWFHYGMALLWEATMKIPPVARAQVRILAEGVTEPALPCDSLPYDLMPTRKFTEEQIRKGLPAARRFGLQDLRCCA